MKSFEELKVYQEARMFRMKISKVIRTFPKEEKYRLADQLIRASRSVTAQIAEGFGRFHHQENIQFCRVARGSLMEVHDHINVAWDEGYLPEEVYRHLIESKESSMRLLNGYINYLKKAKAIENNKDKN